MNQKKVAVLIAGCGHLDGAEISESVLTMLALDSQDVDYQLFSLDKEQYHVVNHLTGEVAENESRNALVESARIARGNALDIAKINIEEFDGLIVTGGFGVAKNLCSFAFDGHQASIDNDVKQAIQNFNAQNKPIGAICIAPVVLALALGEKNPRLTIGDDEGTANALRQLGAEHINSVTTDCVVDKAQKLVTTSAYMDGNARLKDIHQGISALISELKAMMN